jgi:hypothetical protein
MKSSLLVARDYRGSAKPVRVTGPGLPGRGPGWNLATRGKPLPVARVPRVLSPEFDFRVGSKTPNFMPHTHFPLIFIRHSFHRIGLVLQAYSVVGDLSLQ